MKTIKTINTICPCCMEKHDVQIISTLENNIFKKTNLEYEAKYFYCNNADEFYSDEQQTTTNDISMKDAYRIKNNLLTSKQIIEIRSTYKISQNDLSILLGWGAKTITRYESHQVQDVAHDMILRKLSSDPEWFLQLLHEKKESISEQSYKKYLQVGNELFEQNQDSYLKNAIKSRYALFSENTEANGNQKLSLNVVVDMISYYANSQMVTNLFLIKLLKMLWYADALSYKRHGHSMSGLVYRALSFGAVPIAYELINNLSIVNYETTDTSYGTAYEFLPNNNKKYPYLTQQDKDILNEIIRRFGKMSKNDIVQTMHEEDAYKNTPLNEVIKFSFTQTLSIS